ncbi:Hypothetical predicted protein [Cloeon dipterum]|uniref:Uncharacterized protein n=1 Tax=Cloeon dipterum TaxID=197152 RepID=A0A8S1E171_9INSE|nr:Hypothetical predicted protein [Cloeon dipterum]
MKNSFAFPKIQVVDVPTMDCRITIPETLLDTRQRTEPWPISNALITSRNCTNTSHLLTPTIQSSFLPENFEFDILVGIDNLEWKSHQLGTELDFSDAFVADPLALEDDLLYYGRCFINDRYFPGVIFTNGDCRIFINEDLSRHKHKEFQILVPIEPKYKAEE